MQERKKEKLCFMATYRCPLKGCNQEILSTWFTFFYNKLTKQKGIGYGNYEHMEQQRQKIFDEILYSFLKGYLDALVWSENYDGISKNSVPIYFYWDHFIIRNLRQVQVIKYHHKNQNLTDLITMIIMPSSILESLFPFDIHISTMFY